MKALRGIEHILNADLIMLNRIALLHWSAFASLGLQRPASIRLTLVKVL